MLNNTWVCTLGRHWLRMQARSDEYEYVSTHVVSYRINLERFIALNITRRVVALLCADMSKRFHGEELQNHHCRCYSSRLMLGAPLVLTRVSASPPFRPYCAPFNGKNLTAKRKTSNHSQLNSCCLVSNLALMTENR